MAYKDKYRIEKGFEHLFEFNTEKEEIEHLTNVLSMAFLSNIEELMERSNMSRKQLAEKVGTSASYITQLFRGDKLLNLEMIAKFQKVFDVSFEIRTIDNQIQESVNSADVNVLPDFKSYSSIHQFQTKPDYTKSSKILNLSCINAA